MTLKEFADLIINNSDFWEYELTDGIIRLDNDFQDTSYLHISNESIYIRDCYIQNTQTIC